MSRLDSKIPEIHTQYGTGGDTPWCCIPNLWTKYLTGLQAKPVLTPWVLQAYFSNSTPFLWKPPFFWATLFTSMCLSYVVCASQALSPCNRTHSHVYTLEQNSGRNFSSSFYSLRSYVLASGESSFSVSFILSSLSDHRGMYGFGGNVSKAIIFLTASNWIANWFHRTVWVLRGLIVYWPSVLVIVLLLQ